MSCCWKSRLRPLTLWPPHTFLAKPVIIVNITCRSDYPAVAAAAQLQTVQYDTKPFARWQHQHGTDYIRFRRPTHFNPYVKRREPTIVGSGGQRVNKLKLIRHTTLIVVNKFLIFHYLPHWFLQIFSDLESGELHQMAQKFLNSQWYETSLLKVSATFTVLQAGSDLTLPVLSPDANWSPVGLNRTHLIPFFSWKAVSVLSFFPATKYGTFLKKYFRQYEALEVADDTSRLLAESYVPSACSLFILN